MVFIIILTFFLIVLTNLLSNFKLGRVVNFVISLIILYAVFLFITYTPDKEYYTWWIDFPTFSVDKEPTFQIAASYIRAHGHSYQFLHVTFISIYTLLFLFLVSRFSKNVLAISLLFVPLLFIFYGTQLRYFLGYFSAVLGFYYLLVSKQRILSLAFFVFAGLSHYSLILFVPFYFVYFIKGNFFRRIGYLTIVIFIGYLLLTTVIFNLLSGVRFLSYLRGEFVSTYSGGIFSFAPLIPIYILVSKYYNYSTAINPALKDDKKFTFLYKMSIIPMMYLGIALTVQVIGHRYIMTGILFPILLFFYNFNKITDKFKKVQFGTLFFILYIFVFIHFNFSTGLFLGEWEMVDEMGKMLRSNKIIKYLIY